MMTEQRDTKSMTKMKKRGPCPHCCPNGGAILDAIYSGEKPFWQCRNCGGYQKRIIQLRGPRFEKAFARRMRALQLIDELLTRKQGDA
jgi:hypothetical protein